MKIKAKKTAKMISDLVEKYGADSKEVLHMRLVVLSYVADNGNKTYEDCKKVYKKYMK